MNTDLVGNMLSCSAPDTTLMIVGGRSKSLKRPHFTNAHVG
jgi:hypothetical protein